VTAFSYYKIPVVIEAYQMTRLKRLKNGDWPAWLTYAWELPVNVVGSLHAKESMLATGELEITMPQYDLLVYYDDWIVQDIETGITAYRPHVFWDLHEKTYLG
jgi:hypothetical protein